LPFCQVHSIVSRLCGSRPSRKVDWRPKQRISGVLARQGLQLVSVSWWQRLGPWGHVASMGGTPRARHGPISRTHTVDIGC
jgi:hypothetical protein